MTTLRVHLPATLAIAGLALTLGCGSVDPFDDPDAIADELELTNGGLDFEDELPAFGEPELFVEDNEQVPVEDELADEAVVIEMQNAPDAAVYKVAIEMGQLPGDPDNPVGFNWSGQMEISRGAMLVKSLRFEGATDRLLARTDRRVVRFTSATRPHRDGLALLVIDPTPEAAEPLVLTYTQIDGDTFSATLDELVDGPKSRTFDAAGNRMVAVAFRRPVDVCEHGFLRGRWHKVADHRGRLIGRVVDADGNGLGHIRGLWGQRRNGDQVFFGKYINRAGQFQGIFAGNYDDGSFVGRWIVRAGDRGVLGGEYRETVPGPRVGGHFLGRWAETTCNVRIDR